jgi:hypothetical protein
MAGGTPISSPFTDDAYTDIDGAQAYFDGRLNTGAWDDSTDVDKGKALLQATRAIDRLNFSGLRTADYTARVSNFGLDGNLISTSILPPSSDTQSLEFPRNGATTIPQDIVAACCECALAFLDGIDTEAELSQRNVITQKFGAVMETYDPHMLNLAFQNGIPSIVAWNYLFPYLQDPGEITLRRV